MTVPLSADDPAVRVRRAIAWYDELVAAGRGASEAVRQVASAFDVTERTIWRWVYGEAPGKRRRSGRPLVAWSGHGAEDAWAVFVSDYLRLEAPTMEMTLRRVAALAAEQDPAWRIPSAGSFRRRLKAEIPVEVIVRAREGRVAAWGLYPPQERTVADVFPMQILNGDGRRHDRFVIGPTGAVTRPVVWYWQDVRTRRILGWRAGETESSDLVRLSFADVARRYGVPKMMTVDNTHAVSAACLTHQRRRFRGSGETDVVGIFDNLGIRVSRTGIERTAGGRAVGHGGAKPVERSFVDLAERVDKHPAAQGSYTGRSPDAKPENYGERAAPWETFLAQLGEEVDAHNAQTGRRTEAAEERGFDEERSFDAVWEAEYDPSAVRQLTRDESLLLLIPGEATKIRKDGTFRLEAGSATGMPQNRYWAPELIEHRRTRDPAIVARYDPDRLHGDVHVHDTQGRYLCTAQCVLPVGYADVDAAREHNRARTRFLRALDRVERARESAEAIYARHRIEGRAPAPASDPGAADVIPIERRRPDTERRRALKERFEAGLADAEGA